jgi:hypothetical protein
LADDALRTNHNESNANCSKKAKAPNNGGAQEVPRFTLFAIALVVWGITDLAKITCIAFTMWRAFAQL